MAGVQAWHNVHQLPWDINSNELANLIKASRTLAPPASKRPPRHPYTPAYITALRSVLDITLPLEAAVFACLTTCFFSCARLGEFTVRTLNSFDCATNISLSCVSDEKDRENRPVKKFFLPRTKTSQTGEGVFWSRQSGTIDPQEAFNNHLRVNNPPLNAHLFAYKYKRGYRSLTKRDFLKCLAKASRAANLEPLHGHSIRIGGTLEYLLRGVPFDVVKTMGRWSSDAFTGYLRRHAQILAPYLQDQPVIQDSFVRLAMPHPRS